jgi:hypothetical protein
MALLLAAPFFLTSCNPLENDTQSASMLIIESITGKDMQGVEGNLLQSDVLYYNSTTGTYTIQADLAKANLSAQTLDPKPAQGASQFNDIQLDKYFVTYSRSDGKNTPGVDVPYPFEGGISVRVAIGIKTEVTFIVVRETAKQEPPLINLTQPTTRGEVLYMTARIDFYGHDLANKTVKATGYLSIAFADYANE